MGSRCGAGWGWRVVMVGLKSPECSNCGNTGPRHSGSKDTAQSLCHGLSRLLGCALEKERASGWKPTPVFLPGESQGWGSLVGCRSWGEEGNPAGLSSCSGGLRPLVELCVEPAGLCGRCTGVASIHGIFQARVLEWVAIVFSREALYSQQKQDRELTVAQIINSLLPN